MGKTLYLECQMGISGDMTVAALLDLGADKNILEEALQSLPVQGFETKISRVKKAGLDACDFHVMLDAAHENHDHDMAYLHGQHHHEGGSYEEHGGHGHSHGEHSDHGHSNGEHSNHGHGHGEHGGHDHSYERHSDHGEKECGHSHHSHEHRGLPEILAIIEKARITPRAKEIASRTFHILAQAESKAHGVPMEEVHFHEVGAVDSIVDIIGAAVCLDNLDVTQVIIPSLCEGKGTVWCQHGVLPVPVPAVANIVEACRIPLRITEVEGELVTPTGAAIAAAVRTSSRLPEQFFIVKTGLGAGKRSYERPSLLRAMLIEEAEKAPGEASGEKDAVYKLETNIDDCTGEALGYVMDRLMDAGARDVHFIPVYMKKHRPAYELVVICDGQKIKELEQIIFRETTTIGIRRVKMERTTLPREAAVVALREGEIIVKKCILPNGRMRYYPEYASVVKLAQESGASFQEIMDEFKESMFRPNGVAL